MSSIHALPINCIAGWRILNVCGRSKLIPRLPNMATRTGGSTEMINPKPVLRWKSHASIVHSIHVLTGIPIHHQWAKTLIPRISSDGLPPCGWRSVQCGPC